MAQRIREAWAGTARFLFSHWDYFVMVALALLFLASLFQEGRDPLTDTPFNMGAFSGAFLLALAVFLFALALSKLLGRYFSSISRRGKLDRTKYQVFSKISTIVVYFLAVLLFVYSIPSLRDFSATLLAGAGITALIIGLAMQKSVSNLIGGIYLAVTQPIRIGDRVRLDQEFGVIEDITLNYTVLRKWDNEHIVVPNAAISEMILHNYSLRDERMLRPTLFTVAYGTDLKKARTILLEEASKHPENMVFHSTNIYGETVLNEPSVQVLELGDNGVSLRLLAWAKDAGAAFQMACDLRESALARFRKEGIQIPYPTRTVRLEGEAVSRPASR